MKILRKNFIALMIAFSLAISASASAGFSNSKASTSQNTGDLAKEAVSITYNAFKPQVDRAIAQERERFAGMNALNSSGYQLTVIGYGKIFAEGIINQIATLTPQLNNAEKQSFWDASGAEIKRVLSAYCKGYGASSTEQLEQHIDNMIQMKKKFG